MKLIALMVKVSATEVAEFDMLKMLPNTFVRVLSVTSLDLSYALPADLFRRHARSPKGHDKLLAAVDRPDFRERLLDKLIYQGFPLNREEG